MRLKWFSYLFCRASQVFSCKKYIKVSEVYISPYCRLALVPPNFWKFGILGQLTDLITCVKFLVDRFRGYGVLTPQICHFPLTCCVALTTVRQCDPVYNLMTDNLQLNVQLDQIFEH